MNAHPPRTRWHVESYCPSDAAWVPGPHWGSLQYAVAERERLIVEHPVHTGEAATEHRIVLETTTYTDLTTAPGPFRLPNGGFLLTDTANQDLAAIPSETPDGRPAIRLAVGSYEVGHAETTVPLDKLEEVVAGLRELARQQRGQEPPRTVQVRIDGASDLARAIRGIVTDTGDGPTGLAIR